jgi:purine nucleosidase
MPRVIFDTDIGTDVDDLLALACLLGDPGILLHGVTTVYGDVELRARMAQKLLQLCGVEGVPISTGIRAPLLGLDPIFWLGWEGSGLLQPDDLHRLPPFASTSAVDWLIEQVTAFPDELTVLAVGPLTNIAAAITVDPTFGAKVGRLVIMGGTIDARPYAGEITEHNIRCDPEAAHVVFRSGAPIELVPLDVTLKTVIRQSDVDRIKAIGTPYHAAVAGQVERFPLFAKRGYQTYLHDPLAALAVTEPGHFEWHELSVQIELRGQHTRAMTVALPPTNDRPANARVAMHVDASAAEHAILSRLLS